MFQKMSLKLIAAAIVLCVTLSTAWVSPVGAMIFPDFLSLVRIEKDRETENKTANDHQQNKNQDQDNNQNQDKKKAEENVSGNDIIEETHVVKRGDTLWELSQRYSVDWKTIAYANDLGLDGVILPGQKLTIPLGKGSFHTVRPGENLWEIARKYGTSVAELVSANKIENPNRLKVGARLTILGTKSVPAAASVPQNLSSRYEGKWRWPIRGIITLRYGARGNDFHHGLDLAADLGEKIYPIKGGVIEFSGYLNRIYGRAVIVDHGDGVRSLYAHNSENLVEQGERINTSTPIAEIGSTGKSTGPHLHLEVYVDGDHIDPQRLLD